MLYNSERHQSLIEIPWSEETVITTIKDIIDTAYLKRDKSTGLWPIHPKDEFEGSPEFLTDFYMGATGVVWALNNLTNFYKINPEITCSVLIEIILKEHLNLSGKEPYEDRGSFFVGEAGIRLVKQIISPCLTNEEQLKQLIESKFNSSENELLYGLPGCLLMVNFLYERFQNPEYLTLQNKVMEKLLATREIDERSGALIWVQNFQEVKIKYLGAAHGTIGNYSILLKILRKKNTQSHRKSIIQNIERLLEFYARAEDDKCNWPAKMATDSTANLLVHWCHGATGIVTELATEITAEESSIVDQLLIKAGNLIWQAGPLEKGTSLCHGTSGSGMAFLKLYERTNDLLWLQRAQAFAMYSIDQYKKENLEAGQARFSLWTGDLGLALFLRDTLLKKARMPGIDIV